MALPIFIVGAQRAGTSFLASSLESIPGLAPTIVKKPEPRLLMRESWRDKAEFNEAFAPGPAGREVTHLLEKSTSYLEFPVVANRIRHISPDAHVIIILRNPLRRALSHYNFSVAHGLEKLNLQRSLEMDVAGEIRSSEGELSVNPFTYLSRGRYERFLPHWIETIPHSQLSLLIFEDVISKFWDPTAFLTKVGFSSDQQSFFAPSPQPSWNSGGDKNSWEGNADMLHSYASYYGPTLNFLQIQGLDTVTWSEISTLNS
jgi:hypothetical protein